MLIIALVGNMIASASAGNPSIVNYDMFVAVFGMLSLLYLLPTAIMDNFYHPLVGTALDGLNTLFWLCAAIATAAYLGVHKYVCFHHEVSSFGGFPHRFVSSY